MIRSIASGGLKFWSSPGPEREPSCLELQDGSRVAVMGGGPAGAFFCYFLLGMAERIGLRVHVDVFEPKDFLQTGPTGCNMCGGIISESLVQALAAEGINLPPTVVLRGIDSYVLHMDVGSVRIATPLNEMRIAAVHRGAGPRGMAGIQSRGFDEYLLGLALAQGANLVRGRVEEVVWEDSRPRVTARGCEPQSYDLLAVATGVNSAALKLFEGLELEYRPPKVAKTYIAELCLGRDTIEQIFGYSMHVFLLDIPRLEFAALVPKGDFVTLCMLGHEIDDALIQAFLNSEVVQRVLPDDLARTKKFCHCSPRINIAGPKRPFADRLVFIGDCGVTRLYKDGIGAAYRTAKAAAVTAVFAGISGEDFQRSFWPACRSLTNDNRIGKIVFAASRLFQRGRLARRGILRMVQREQNKAGRQRRMSAVLWNTFTGSAPYGEILLATLHPFYIARLAWETALGAWPFHRHNSNHKP